MTSFAYLHARPSTTDVSGIFYVGKGNLHRSNQVVSRIRRSEHHQRIVAKYGAENILVGRIECSSESIAFNLERGLIRCLRASGVLLANRTDGGEGASGLPKSEETRRKISASLMGHKLSEETRKKIGDGNRGKIVTAEVRAKISAGYCKTSRKPRKPLSDSHKLALSVAGTGRVLSDESRAKISARRTGMVFSESHKAALKAAWVKRKSAK